MKSRILSREEALLEGASLWILPAQPFSEWTRLLDWPLNLQITRAVQYSRPEFTKELSRIVTENDLLFQRSEFAGRPPILIGSGQLLPNIYTLIVPDEQWEPWRDACIDCWQKLGKPKLRLFLPTFVKWEKVQHTWPTTNAPDDIEVVESSKEAESRAV